MYNCILSFNFISLCKFFASFLWLWSKSLNGSSLIHVRITDWVGRSRPHEIIAWKKKRLTARRLWVVVSFRFSITRRDLIRSTNQEWISHFFTSNYDLLITCGTGYAALQCRPSYLRTSRVPRSIKWLSLTAIKQECYHSQPNDIVPRLMLMLLSFTTRDCVRNNFKSFYTICRPDNRHSHFNHNFFVFCRGDKIRR